MRLTGMVDYMRSILRLPFRQIQAFLQSVHRARLSVGELVNLSRKVEQKLDVEVTGIQNSEQLSTLGARQICGYQKKLGFQGGCGSQLLAENMLPCREKTEFLYLVNKSDAHPSAFKYLIRTHVLWYNSANNTVKKTADKKRQRSPPKNRCRFQKN